MSAENTDPIAAARSQFETPGEDASSQRDPTAIKDDIAHYKELHTKLKFQYLEQEARDKFLRLLFVDSGSQISQAHIDELAQENLSSKAQLDSVEAQAGELRTANELLAEKTISLRRILESQNELASQLLDEVQALQREIDQLLQDPENDNHRELFAISELLDSENLGIEETLEIGFNAVQQHSVAAQQLEHEIKQATEGSSAADRTISALSEQIKRLETEIKRLGEQPLSQKEPDQVHAQWLRELNSSLEKFVPKSLEFQVLGDHKYELLIGKEAVHFDEKLRILSARKIPQKMISEVNYAPQDLRFWKLLRALAHLILAND